MRLPLSRLLPQKHEKTGTETLRNTEWHRIVVFGRLAEVCGEYLAKGRSVYVEGSIRTRSWDDREGNKRYTTEIVGRTVQFLSPKGERGRQSGGAPPAEDDFSYEEGAGMTDDDVPF